VLDSDRREGGVEPASARAPKSPHVQMSPDLEEEQRWLAERDARAHYTTTTGSMPYGLRGEDVESTDHRSPFFKNVQCVKETEILVEQQPPQGVLVCDHAGLVINKFSHRAVFGAGLPGGRGGAPRTLQRTVSDEEHAARYSPRGRSYQLLLSAGKLIKSDIY